MHGPFVDFPSRQQFSRIFDILPRNPIKADAKNLMNRYQEETSDDFQEGFIEGLGCALQLLDLYKRDGNIEVYSELEQNLLTVLGAASRLRD